MPETGKQECVGVATGFEETGGIMRNLKGLDDYTDEKDDWHLLPIYGRHLGIWTRERYE